MKEKHSLRTLRLCVTSLLLIAAISISSARSRKGHREAGTPGVFDYYVFSLSWSPEFCAGPSGSRDAAQCGEGRQYGFVVHGLWPQYERGFPESCAAPSPVGATIVEHMLPLMPSPHLIQHEWDQHGTCSGLAPAAYFETIRNVRAVVKIPSDYTAPLRQLNVSPAEIKQKFVAANAGFGSDSVHALCSGRFVSEVRICFSKDLKPRACGAGVRDTCAVDPAILRPVR
jgi:ribonuclease T2